ncbi:type IV secretory system conjugative DNA transfer family protein [Amorphus sp. MBR-141]
MPIKWKLGLWATVVPIVVAFFIGEIVNRQYLDSLADLAVFLVVLYLIWAGTYWTLLQARRLYLITQPGARGSTSTRNAPDRARVLTGDIWWEAGRGLRRLRTVFGRRSAKPADRSLQGSVPEKSQAELELEAFREAALRNEIPSFVYSPYLVVQPKESEWRLTASVAETQLDAPGVPQAHLDIVQAIHDLGCKFEFSRVEFARVYEKHLQHGEIDKAEGVLRRIIIPHGPPELYQRILHAGGGSRFAAGKDLEVAGLFVAGHRRPDAIEVGIGEPPAIEPAAPLFHQGEGHILTIASTGAGKGQCYILPTLMTYGGPVLCLDPKGENYRFTGIQREMFGGVFKWAPFDRNGETHAFNPFDVIEDWDDARVVADLLIAPADSGEKRFWDQSARDFVRGLIMHVRTLEPERRNMREVVRILYASNEDHEELRQRLAESDDEMLVELANQFDVMAERMFESILQSARAELEVWRSKPIANATSMTSPGWDIRRFVSDVREREAAVPPGGRYGALGYHWFHYQDEQLDRLERGPSKSVFFIIPPDRIRSYASVLRVIMGVHLNAWARAESLVEEEHTDWRVDHQAPALFIFDELAQLGHMPLIEDQIAIARSAKIRMWLIAQDLPQLKVTYPRWESMLGNCRTQIFFGVNDLETATYVSSRAGDKTTVFEETRPLVPPAELMGPAFKNHAVVFARATPPVKVRLPQAFHQDDRMSKLAETAIEFNEQYPRADPETASSAAKALPGQEVTEEMLSGEPTTPAKLEDHDPENDETNAEQDVFPATLPVTDAINSEADPPEEVEAEVCPASQPSADSSDNRAAEQRVNEPGAPNEMTGETARNDRQGPKPNPAGDNSASPRRKPRGSSMAEASEADGPSTAGSGANPDVAVGEPTAPNASISSGASVQTARDQTAKLRATNGGGPRPGQNGRQEEALPHSPKANAAANQSPTPRKKPRPRKRPATPTSRDE